MTRRRQRIQPRIYLNGARPAKPTANLRLQGVAAALGTLARDHREPDLAAMVLDSLGLTITGYGKDSNRILTQWRLKDCWAGGSKASRRLEQQHRDAPTAARVAASTPF
jgi:hypothetical protein